MWYQGTGIGIPTRYRSILKPIPNECHDAWPSLGSSCTSVKFKLKIKGAVAFENGLLLLNLCLQM